MEQRKKIAFIPGAFRPFGCHHMKMVEHYSDMCDDVVLVISSPRSGDSKRETNVSNEISPEDAKTIVDLCIGDSGLENVSSKIDEDGNPIRAILRAIAQLSDCDVVLGVGDKDEDANRFGSIDRDYFKNNNVQILPPDETSFAAVEDDDGVAISASDIRKHVDDKDMLKAYLPVFVEDDTFQKIYDILNGKSKNRLDTKDELMRGAAIFRDCLEEDQVETSDEDNIEGDVETSDEIPMDEEETEFSGIVLSDSAIDDSKCSIIAYNTHILEDEGSEVVYNPKNNPDKAVDMLIELGDGNVVEIYLDTESGEWDSRVNGCAKLTPDQMGQFFGTDFCKKVDRRLEEIWPESDPFFKRLLEAVRRKKLSLEPVGVVNEDGEFRKGNINKEKSREKNAAGEQIYTNSGRKIVSFSDFGVKHDDEEAYYCWPQKGKEFKWSQWADWKKIHPLLRMRFSFLSYTYGLSMSPLPEDNKNRGFRAYNLDLEPKLQYLTPIETAQMMDLTIVQKFLRNSYKRLKKFVDIPDEEIFEKIGRPDKCTIGDIRKTKHVIRNSMKAIKERRADTYIYT